MTESPVATGFSGPWNRRRLLLIAGGAAVAPCLAASNRSDDLRSTLARELGLTGMGARSLIDQVRRSVGAPDMASQRSALLARIAGFGGAEAELADLVRMWVREDFAQDRTTIIGGLRFAESEIGVFALVGQG